MNLHSNKPIQTALTALSIWNCFQHLLKKLFTVFLLGLAKNVISVCSWVWCFTWVSYLEVFNLGW